MSEEYIMKRTLLCCLGLLALLFSFANAEEESGLKIYFLDVGQADAAVILCEGESLMIDGGNAADSSFIYSFLTNTLHLDHLNTMIASHPHEDHVGGLSGALNACTVDTLYTPTLEYDTKAFRAMINFAKQQSASIVVPQPGDSFSVGSALVEILAPLHDYENTNDTSIVAKITYGDTSFLFTGDIEWEAEHDLVDSGVALSADVLKVPHHGSDTSSSYVFLRAVMPSYAIISVGEDNAYGHPAEDTLSRLRDSGADVLRTDMAGTIQIYSDGVSLQISTERGG